ncbi:glycosyl hydrolase 2 galactose-binding domain-containing protein [Agarivorans sp.]|uniref:beta-mannosidase n=1 Tax=Agarivorans sp. TaxID=1872412 RepID=UPI003CFC0FEE
MMAVLALSEDWWLSSPQHPQLNLPCKMPLDNYSVLLEAGLIDDPYQQCNESKVQWVAKADWCLSHEFELELAQLDKDFIELKLSRLDTVVDVYINQHKLASCDNMFRLWRFDIKPWLKAGRNQLQLYFHRADVAAQQRAGKLPFVVPSSMSNNQVPFMNSLRKTQCHAGWDWGICLMVSGVYETPQICFNQQARLLATQVEQHWSADGVTLHLKAEHQLNSQQDIHFQFAEHSFVVTAEPGCEVSQTTLHITEPQLWWPAGYGEQVLHRFTVTLGEQRIEKKVGLRKLQLNTQADSLGSAMTVMINDVAITAKGANWIPMDAMPQRQSVARYQQLLGDAKAANMNMLRVWGGGQYESDVFYQLCDELGLMVWQDMMFACSLYPSTDDFVANVELELRDQIRRLRDYSCIVLWCGDNEVIGAINWYPESKQNRERYVVNYDRLNRAIQKVVQACDPSRVFWPSSPCNGELDYGDAWHDDNKGDMHFWDVWHSGKSFSAYQQIKPRFCSEFGYQSWPSLAEVKTFVAEEDWNISSPTFECHQKNPSGNSIITEMFTRLFRFPANFEQMLYLSQVQQALAIKTACDYWRANSPWCRGMLYWQLNDNWPVSSWSSIEYSGRWKQLHYHAKRFFAPQYASFVETEQGLQLHMLNDSRQKLAMQCRLRWFDWQGQQLSDERLELELSADENALIWHCEAAKLAKKREAGFFIAQWQSEAQELQNSWFSGPPKALAMVKAKVSFEFDAAQQSILLTSDKPAFFVHLEADAPGRFEDSSFTLLPNEVRKIRYWGDDYPQMAASLRVYHLTDSY